MGCGVFFVSSAPHGGDPQRIDMTNTTSTDGPLGHAPLPWIVSQAFEDGAWTAPAIEPYGPPGVAANARVLHYGQSVFEGIKATRQESGGVAIFRPAEHLARLTRSCERLCIPPPDNVPLLRAIGELVSTCADSVPDAPGFLYIRPFVFATQEDLIPSASDRYRLMVLIAPAATLFPGGARICTVPDEIRAAPGGTGSIKCAGNYAAALHARSIARARGFDEVLWLDALERSWVEETGSMNLMVVRRGELVTPPLSDTILPGITRRSLLELAPSLGIRTVEERVPVDPDYWSDVTEVFSAGTAAGTSHVAEIEHEGTTLFKTADAGPVATLIGDALRDIVFGRRPDTFDWLHPISARSAGCFAFASPSWIHG